MPGAAPAGTPGVPLIFGRLTRKGYVVSVDIEGLLTVREACAVLGVSRVTLYRLAGDGELRLLKVRSSTRFLKADVLGFVERCAKRAGDRVPDA